MQLLDTSNAAYHADKTHLSSSALKLLLKDPLAFKAKHVDGIKEPEEYKTAFEDGTLVHVLILEPETISNYAVFPGLRRAGNAWEQFKLDNPNKICISAAQMLRAEKLYKSHAGLDVSVGLIRNGFAEHNMFGEISGLKLKARADYIVPKKYIVDVKTTAMPSGTDIFKQTCIDYGYHLSASLYLEIAQQTYNVEHDFYWLVLSKDDGQCHVYKMGEETKLAGKALVQRAVLKYNQSMATGIWTNDAAAQDRSSLTYEVETI